MIWRVARERGECYWCGKWAYLDVHHVFEGSKRQASDKHGFTVKLCRVCHNTVHSGKGLSMRKELHEEFQKIYEFDHSREDFIKEFGISYL